MKDRDVDVTVHGIQRMCANVYHRHVHIVIEVLVPPDATKTLYHIEGNTSGSMYVIYKHVNGTLEDIVSGEIETYLMQVPRKALNEQLTAAADEQLMQWEAWRNKQ